MSFLTISKVSKRINEKFILNKVSFTQERFQKIAIAGETGSGKSTLLKVIAGLMQSEEGAVLFKNERVQGPEEKLIPGHAKIGFLSQHFELRNNYTVEEILLMYNKIPDQEAGIIYEVCRISHLLKRKTDQLSGGEKQRIATAKLLISSPELLLLDEPYSNLDIIHKNILKSVIKDIGEQLKITCIMISHDPLDTLSWADEIIVMKDGYILQKGTPQQIYLQPVNEYTAGLFGNYNLINSPLIAAYNNLHSTITFENKLLIRPENFILSTNENSDLRGIVDKVSFFGSYYEVDVFVLDTIITVKTKMNGIIKGDNVSLFLDPGRINS